MGKPKSKVEVVRVRGPLAQYAAAFEEAAVATLAIKSERALRETKYTRLVVAGGVSANTHLRETLDRMAESLGAKVYYPRHEFCTDNGAMIAFAGCKRLLAGEHQSLSIEVKARWPLDSLQKIA